MSLAGTIYTKYFEIALFICTQNPWTAAAQYPMSTNSCMAPQGNMPSFMGVPGTTSPIAGHTHAQFQTHASHAHAHAQQAMEMTTGYGTLEGFGDDRRSSSIAALRLKAREHVAIHGILSAYAK